MAASSSNTKFVPTLFPSPARPSVPALFPSLFPSPEQKGRRSRPYLYQGGHCGFASRTLQTKHHMLQQCPPFALPGAALFSAHPHPAPCTVITKCLSFSTTANSTGKNIRIVSIFVFAWLLIPCAVNEPPPASASGNNN